MVLGWNLACASVFLLLPIEVGGLLVSTPRATLTAPRRIARASNCMILTSRASWQQQRPSRRNAWMSSRRADAFASYAKPEPSRSFSFTSRPAVHVAALMLLAASSVLLARAVGHTALSTHLAAWTLKEPAQELAAQAVFPNRKVSYLGSALELPRPANALDLRRLVRAAWFGLGFTGMATGLFYLGLDRAFGLGSAGPLVRTAFDALLFAPFALLPAHAVFRQCSVDTRAARPFRDALRCYIAQAPLEVPRYCATWGPIYGMVYAVVAPHLQTASFVAAAAGHGLLRRRRAFFGDASPRLRAASKVALATSVSTLYC